ncbi:MAG: dimethyl sulfoxide reductase anchor subunit [Bacteroidales bacterium]|nr:dimethyl sulfoxide reductase anchor subunit [Bacteroidales bacterium]
MSANYFIFDENKCVGCEACVIACINENGFQHPETWRNVHLSNPQKRPDLPLFYLSMSCNHCENAVCMDNCPALAYSRSIITGAVLHHQEACIGCQYCTWHCPYDAPKYNPFAGVIEKCNFCEARLVNHQEPACASLCPTGALNFSFDEIDKHEIKSNLETPINTYPSIIIKETIKEKAPETDKSLFSGTEISGHKAKQKPKITAKKEWALVVFTLIISVMTAISAQDILNKAELKTKLLFLALGAMAAFLSSLHLGKPLRAWRALLNVKKSWLSREILFFTVYYLLILIDLLIIQIPKPFIILTALLLILSIDKLYQPAQLYWTTKIHSAQLLFLSLSYYLMSSKLYWLLLIIMMFRLYLFAKQSLKAGFKNKFKLNLRILRIASIFFTGILLILSYSYPLIITVFSIGEIIDRILFYDELEVATINRS